MNINEIALGVYILKISPRLKVKMSFKILKMFLFDRSIQRPIQSTVGEAI